MSAVTQALREELHGKLEVILDYGYTEYSDPDPAGCIRTAYHEARWERVRKNVLRSVGRDRNESTKYPVSSDLILKTPDLERAGPIALQALTRVTGELQWIDPEAGRMTSAIRYSLEPGQSGEYYDFADHFLGFAVLRVRFSDDRSDSRIKEQEIQLVRADYASWMFECPFSRESEHHVPELFMTYLGLFICPDCTSWSEGNLAGDIETYRKCAERQKRETVCFTPIEAKKEGAS